MRPAPGQDISKANTSKQRDVDVDVEPLSKLAAERPEQRAEHFAFTSDDRELLDLVLASADDDDEPAPSED
jgi:hypothetical protein